MSQRMVSSKRPGLWLAILVIGVAVLGLACGIGGGAPGSSNESLLTPGTPEATATVLPTRRRTPRPVATFPVITSTPRPSPTPPSGTEGMSWLIADLSGAGDDCNDLAFSPDGSVLAVAGRDEMVRLIDPVSGETARTLVGHEGRVNQVDFSPGGEWLFSAGDDGTLMQWELATGARISVFGDSSIGKVTAMDVSPDGRRIVSSGGVGVVNLWDAASGERLYRIINHLSTITSLCFNPGSNQIASADTRGVLSLSPVDGTVGSEFTRDPKAIQDLVYTPDGRLVSANATGVWIWDISAGSALVLEPVPSVGAVDRLAVSWDGSLLAALGHDGTTWVWDLDTYQLRAVVTPAEWSALTLAFSPVCQACPEGKGWTLAIGGEDGHLSLWGILQEAN